AVATVVRARGPIRRLSDVAELFLRVENRRDRLARIRVQRLADPDVRRLERGRHVVGDRLLGRTFEQDAEPDARTRRKAVVQRRLFLPRLELLEYVRIARSEFDHALVRLDREVDVALRIRDLA